LRAAMVGIDVIYHLATGEWRARTGADGERHPGYARRDRSRRRRRRPAHLLR
jgi:hypothetical protein